MNKKQIVITVVVTLCVIGLSVGLSCFTVSRSDAIAAQESQNTAQELEKTQKDVELLVDRVDGLEGELEALEATVQKLEDKIEELEPEEENTEEEEETKSEPQANEDAQTEDGDESESSGEVITEAPTTIGELKGVGQMYDFARSFNEFAEEYHVGNRIELISPLLNSNKQVIGFWIDLNDNIGVHITQSPKTKKITNIDIYAMEFVMSSEAAFLVETIRTSAQALGIHSQEGVQAILDGLQIDGQILPDDGHYATGRDGVSYVMDLSEENGFTANIIIN